MGTTPVFEPLVDLPSTKATTSISEPYLDYPSIKATTPVFEPEYINLAGELIYNSIIFGETVVGPTIYGEGQV